MPGHVFVRHFGVDADHLGMVEGGDESQHVTGGWVVDIAARFVGLGFEREFQIIFLIERIFAQEVHRFAVAFDGFDRALARIRFGAFASAPEDVDLRAEFHAQVNGVHRLLQGIGAHFWIVGGESAILEDRVAEQVGGRHRDNETGISQRLAEILFDGFGFGGGGVDRDQVVVVEVDAVRADFAQQVNKFGGCFVLAHRPNRTGRVRVLPTVHSPKVNLCSGFGSNDVLIFIYPFFELQSEIIL